MRKATFFVLVAVLSADLVHKVWADPKSTLLGAQELLLLALMIFVGAGDRVVEFALGEEWVKIKQSVDQQARAAERDIGTLVALSEDPRPDVVEELLRRATGQDKDV